MIARAKRGEETNVFLNRYVAVIGRARARASRLVDHNVYEGHRSTDRIDGIFAATGEPVIGSIGRSSNDE